MKKLTVGISYATEQQDEINEFVKELKKREIKYKYDKEHPHLFWGEYAPQALSEFYNTVDCIIAFVSSEYLKKALPRYEMRIAFTKHIETLDDSYYFLPVVYKDVKMPEYYHGNFHIWRDYYTLSELADIVGNKLKQIQKRYKDIFNFKKSIERNLKDCDSITITNIPNSKSFSIISSDKKTTIFKFLYKTQSQEYEVYDYINKLKAVITPESTAIKIINYGFFPGIECEYAFEEFLNQLKEILR